MATAKIRHSEFQYTPGLIGDLTITHRRVDAAEQPYETKVIQLPARDVTQFILYRLMMDTANSTQTAIENIPDGNVDVFREAEGYILSQIGVIKALGILLHDIEDTI